MPIEFTFVPGSGAAVAAADATSRLSQNVRDAIVQSEDVGFQNVVLDALAVSQPRLPVSSVRLVVNHRAGSGSPVAAARRFWSIAERSNGRVALRVVEGGEEGSAAPIGENHLRSWQRTDEYLTLLRRLWKNDRPFDHEGPFYSIRGGFVPGAASSSFNAPIRMGGLSGTALKIAARHADVFELAPGALSDTRLLMERVRAAAAEHGRSSRIRFALPIVVSSEGQPGRASQPLTVEPVAQAALLLLSYVEAGVSEFMVSASDPADIRQFSANVAALVRNSAARLEGSEGVTRAPRGPLPVMLRRLQ